MIFCGEILSAFKKMPVVVKPATQGSSIGVEIVKNDTDINSAMEKAFTYSREVVVEEFIHGKELTVAIMQDGGHGCCIACYQYRTAFRGL